MFSPRTATALWLAANIPYALALSPAILQSRHTSSHDALQKRDETTTQIAAPISVPPSQYWDGIDGPWSSFAIQLGTPPQFVRTMPSTAGWVTWGIGPDGCPNGYVDQCSDKRGFLFLKNQSLTWIENSKFQLGFEQNLELDPASIAGYDQVTLGFKGSGGPSIAHSVLYVVDSPKQWMSGFGLNPVPANFSTMNVPQPSFMQQLFNNKSIASLAYAYTAGNQYRFNKVSGSLTLGGYDENRFTSTNLTFPMYNDVQRDLLVNLQRITTGSGGSQNLLPGGGIPIFVDSTVAQLYLPLTACQAFEQAFGLQWDSTYEFYIVNASHRDTLLSQNANVTFTLGTTNSGGNTVDIVLPYRAFDLQLQYPNVLNTSYYFPLKRATNDTQYTLGRTFLQEAYLIADYERRNFTVAPCLWDSQKIVRTLLRPIISPGISTGSSSSSGLAPGAIAGIVVGVVAAITLIAAILYFWRRRRTHESQRRVAELEAKEAEGLPKEASSPIDEPTSAIGTSVTDTATLPQDELDSSQVHEMSVSKKNMAAEMDSPHKVDPKNHGYSEMEGGEFYGPEKHYAYEMDGVARPVYEMPGSDVQELSTPVDAVDVKDSQGPK